MRLLHLVLVCLLVAACSVTVHADGEEKSCGVGERVGSECGRTVRKLFAFQRVGHVGVR